MNKKIITFLNQPFILWFMSTVIVGLISWQYAEIQENSTQRIEDARLLRKANLELVITLEDINFFVSNKDNLTLEFINTALMRMQYNLIDNRSPLGYVPTLLNIMLEIDSRAKLDGVYT